MWKHKEGAGMGRSRRVPKKKKKGIKRETEKDEPRNKYRTARGRGQGRETWIQQSEKGRPEVAPGPALCLLGAKEAEVGTAGTPQP